MAIQKRPERTKPYRVYWNNPKTGKRESRSFETLRDARICNADVLRRLKEEPDSFADADDEPTGGTVREIVALYIAAKGFKGINLVNTLHHLKPVLEAMGKREVASLTRQDLVRFLSDQMANGVKQLTAHRRLSVLRSGLAWASEQGLIAENPLAGIKIPKGKPLKLPPPTTTEAAQIMQAAQPHIQRVVILGMYMGVRVGPSEMLSMQWSNVDLARGIIRVKSANKGGDAWRDIPISTALRPHISAWAGIDIPAGMTHIVNYLGKPVKSIKTGWRKALQRAGIARRIRPYDLRHAFATLALDAGADINAVAANMGHTDPTMVLKHYQHVKEAMRREAVESIPEIPLDLGTSPGHIPDAFYGDFPCAHTKKQQ